MASRTNPSTKNRSSTHPARDHVLPNLATTDASLPPIPGGVANAVMCALGKPGNAQKFVVISIGGEMLLIGNTDSTVSCNHGEIAANFAQSRGLAKVNVCGGARLTIDRKKGLAIVGEGSALFGNAQKSVVEKVLAQQLQEAGLDTIRLTFDKRGNKFAGVQVKPVAQLSFDVDAYIRRRSDSHL